MLCFMDCQSACCLDLPKCYMLLFILFLASSILNNAIICYHVYVTMLSYLVVMLKYMKKLYFLPIRYHINFKIALLVFKCLKHCALGYLQQLVALCKPSAAYTFRSNCDMLLLETTSQLNYNKSASIFSHSSVSVWNNLPFDIRETSNISLFKTKLKTHYFHIAFVDVPDID